jgi:threonine dehydrogenase-like Zn-dependent dehydrogenase
MGQAFNQALAALYKWIPPAARPFFKNAFLRTQIRLAGLLSWRRVRRGRRVTFLDFEIAYLEEFEYLSPAAGEVEVLARHSTVSPGTERAVLCGLPGARRAFPYVPGYSCAGTVRAVGRGVRGFRPGDPVAGRVRHSSADSVSLEVVFAVPPGVDLESASFIELGIITLQGIRKARILPGDRVAVLGQGLIGQLANRVARAIGAGEVIAMAPSRSRAAISLARGGADQFLTTAEADFRPESVAADVVIEAVGTPDAIAYAARCARDGGRVVLLGSSRGLSRGVDLSGLVRARGLEIIGAHISNLGVSASSPGRHTYRQEGEFFLDLLRSRRLSVADLVTWRPAPAECNAVYEAIARGAKGHVAIVFDWAASPV